MATLQLEPAYLQWAVGNEGKIFAFDVVTSEQHSITSELASHPVERGVNIVDNVNQNPDEIMLEGIVSETPISSIRNVQGAGSYPMSVRPLDLKLPDGRTYRTVTVPIKWPITAAGVLSNGLVGLPLTGLDYATRPRGYQAQVRDTPRKQSVSALTLQADSDFDPVADALLALRSVKEGAILVSVFTPKWAYSNMVLTSISMTRDMETGAAATFSLTLQNVRVVNSRLVKAPTPSEARAKEEVPKGNQPAEEVEPQKQSILEGTLGAAIDSFKSFLK